MKIGKNLQELAIELKRRAESKKDYIANTKTGLEAVVEGKEVKLKVGSNGNAFLLGINDHAHSQIAERLKIPAVYYSRMRETNPDLLATNVNAWFDQDPADRMLRTMDGKLRAFLSDKFQTHDDVDFAEAILPVLMGNPNITIVSGQLTETRFYIKAIDNSISKDIPKGHAMGDGTHTLFDTLCPAATFSNSEVGNGAVDISGGIFTRACTNLAFFNERSMRKMHIGGKQTGFMGEDNYHLLSDETRRATDQALWMQARDTAKNIFDALRFEALVEKAHGAAKDKIEGDPVKVVELTAKRFSLNEGERTSVLRHLIQGGDLSKWGLSSAITRTAEDLEDYDRASAFERLGGTVVDLSSKEWREIAKAA